MDDKKIGKILTGKYHPLRMRIGTIKNDTTGDSYELSNASVSGEMLVVSNKSQKAFTIGWDEVVRMAEDAGINER